MKTCWLIDLEHREHTILLRRMREDKRKEGINCLPLSPVVISYANLQRKPLPGCSAKLVPRPFCAVQKFFWFTYNLTREATLRANILKAIRKLARISKFLCFHETRQTQNEVERLFYNLAELVFRILSRQSENFSVFCKVLSQIAFRYMIVPLPLADTRHPARAHAPLRLPHMFF